MFDVILKNKACNNDLEDIMDFPMDDPYKLSDDQITSISQKLCNMTSTQEERFKFYTKPDDDKIKEEAQIFTSLLTSSFYPIPLGASAPVIKIYQRSIKMGFRSVQTSLALIKYYICPNFLSEMEAFFIK